MLTYSYKLNEYIQNNVIPQLIIGKNYKIIGSFIRKSHYITDIDLYNFLGQKENLYNTIVQHISKFNDNNIIFVNIYCGRDERFIIADCEGRFNEKSLDNYLNIYIKELYNVIPKNKIEKLNKIVEKYKTNFDKLKYNIIELVKPYYKLKWSREEINSDKKILFDGKIIKLSEIIMNSVDIYVRFKYFFRIKKYYIGFDIALKNQFNMSIFNNAGWEYRLQYARYNKEYYYLLYFFRKKMQDKYKEINNIIEIKFGLYKQLITRIKDYHLLYDSKLMNIEIATNFVITILNDIININYPPETIDLIRKNYFISDNDEKIKIWNDLLSSLYSFLYNEINNLSKNYFRKYYNMLPENEKPNFYLK